LEAKYDKADLPSQEQLRAPEHVTSEITTTIAPQIQKAF
jgi:hypothetical protein